LNKAIHKVLIVGSGWVGRQVAARMAAFGVAVALTDKDPSVVADALQWMQHCGFSTPPLTMEHGPQPAIASDSSWSVSNVVSSSDATGQFLDAGTLVPWLERVEPFPAIDQLTREQLEVWQPDLAIECVPEQLSLKKRVLRTLSNLVPETCIIASNTSYFVPSVLSQFVKHPERFAHLHFHVPVLRESVADIVGCSSTSPDVLHSLSVLCQRIGQYPLVLKREHPGYVFNWLLQSVLKAAMELVALDVVDVEEVDRSWKSVTGMPLGPFGMMDQIGLDVIEQVLSNSRWVAPPEVDTQQLLAVLRPLIQEGRLGTKSGSGFYNYQGED